MWWRPRYPDARALVADVHLTFDNAILYNPPDHEVTRCGFV